MNKIVYRPINLVTLYLFGTLGVFFWIYRSENMDNFMLTIVFCSICFLAMYLGFFGTRKKINHSEYYYSKIIRNILIFSCMVTLISSFYNILTFYPSLRDALIFLRDPGAAYEYVKYINRYGLVENQGSSFVGITLNSLSFTKYIVFTFPLLYWGKLKKTLKVLVISTMLMYFVQSILIGAMINIGTIFMVIFPILVIKFSDTKNKKNKILILIIPVITLLTLSYFLGTRTVAGFDEDHIIISGMYGLLYYVSNGYVGLSGCFDIPFTSTFGQTTFHGIFETVLPSLGMSTNFENSYLVKNEYYNGWDASVTWSTAFAWIASDISFYLVPFVMFFVGICTKRVWLNAVINQNPFAFLLMGQIMIFCFMIPANNQLFLTWGNSIGTIAIIIMYFIFRRAPVKKTVE